MVGFLYQDLDTPYMGEDEIDNPEGRRTLQRVFVVQGEWGLGERFAARLFIPVRDFSASGEIELNDSGLGDVEAWGRWAVGPEMGKSGGVLAAGLAFPTGSEVDDPEVVEENIIFGAGDYSLLLSAEGFRRFGTSHTLFGIARYRYALGAGGNGYRFGDDFGWSGTWQWKPRGGPLGLTAGLSGQHLGEDRQDGAPVISRGGRLHYASGGVSFALGEKGGTIGFLAQRLIEQDVRGDQLLAPYNFTAAYTFSWGEHAHEAPPPGPKAPTVSR